MSGEPSESPDLDLLIVECYERFEREGQNALTELCARYPEHSEELRTAMDCLVDHGVASVQAVPPSSFRVGSRIGGYELRSVVGRGGMGIVYEAFDHQLNRRVAVKVLRTPVELDDDAATRFRREAEIAASLDHPGLVRVFSAGVHEGHPWLAMEFVAGRGLDEWIEEWRDSLRGESWDLRRRVQLALQVAEALAPMHARGLVHRDVKPSNILVRDDGTAALGDFGLARRIDDLGLTQSGAFAGTVHYASPEQAAGESRALSPASDVFSLGVTLYELLTLAKPFDGPTQRGILDSIERNEPVDPSKLVPGMPDDLGAVLMKALEKSVAVRYSSAGDFAEDLRAYLEHRPVRARRVSRIGRVRRWVRREPLRATMALVVAVAALVVAGVLGYSISQRPLIEQARQQRLQKLADQAAMRGWIGMTMSTRLPGILEAFEQALELDPSPRLALGLALAEKVVHGEAAELGILDAWIERFPASRVLRRRRAKIFAAEFQDPERSEAGRRALAELGPPQEAEEYYLEAVEMAVDIESKTGDPTDQTLSAMKALLDGALLGAERPYPEVYWALGSSYYGVVGGPAAAAYVRSVLRLWPNTGYAEALAGLALVATDGEQAIAHFERALSLDPDLGFLHGELADLHRMRGDLDRAEAACRTGLAADPKDVACLRVLAVTYEERGMIDEAFESMDASVLAGGQSGLAVSRSSAALVGMCQRHDRHDYGFERLKAYVKRVPDVPALRVLLSRMASAVGEDELAGDTLDDWLGIYPPSASVLSERAELAYRRGDYPAAIQDLEEALRIAPGKSTLRINLQSVLQASGDYEGAAAAARELARRSNYQPMPLLRLARAEFKAGQLVAGRHHLKMAREMLEATDEPNTPAMKLLVVLEGRHLPEKSGDDDK